MKTIEKRRGCMRGKVFLSIMFALSMVLSNSIGAMADEIQKKKLGYGFEPGLVAGKDYVAGQLIVGIKEGMSTLAIFKVANASGGKLVKKMGNTAVLLQFSSEEAVKDAAHSLIKLPNVSFVERNGFMSIPPKPLLPDIRGQKNKGLQNKNSIPGDMNAQSVSADAGTGYQWHLTVIRKTAALGVLSATPPTVAVIDTGVDYTHPDLSGKVFLGKNCVTNNFDPYDDNGHGTHVAGIIAAKAGNGQYGEGVSPNSKILAVKVLSASGSGTFFDVAEGMKYARTAVTTPPTKVINMSLGGPASALVAAEVLAIKNAGKVLVAAAGNSNTTTPSYPGGDVNTALRVMATEENDARAWFSNFSPSATPSQYNIAAPGWEILSTVPAAGYEPMSGTSMASPVVAGAAALVWGQLPALTRDGLVARLVTKGKLISKGFPARARRVDVRQALLGTTERAIVGRILDPATGKAPSSPLAPVSARLFSGVTPLALDLTNSGGSYEMTGLGTGTSRILRGNKGGYANAMVRNNITIASVAGPYTDALPKSRATGNATITIDWSTVQPIVDTTGCIDGCNGWEFDLWVRLPNGSYVYWGNPGDFMTSPFVGWPRDSFADYEPLETIVIGNSASNGVYKVFVDKYPYTTYFSPSWTGSQMSAQIYNGATSIGTLYSPPVSCGTNRYWHIGNLTKNGTSYVWTNVNICTNTIP